MLPHQQTSSPTPIPGLTEGRQVNYVLRYGVNAGQIRPAFIVRVWKNQDIDSQGLESQDLALGCCNLVVFVDGTNDYPSTGNIIWETSRYYSEDKEPGTWHCPEIQSFPLPTFSDFESNFSKLREIIESQRNNPPVLVTTSESAPHHIERLFLSRAEIAYNAYKQSAGGVTYRGFPLPEWNNLTVGIQGHWLYAVKAAG